MEDKENFLTPLATPRRSSKRVGAHAVLSPSKSLDQGMNILGTPGMVVGKDELFATPASRDQTTPNKSNKVFGSIERGLDKMKNILTFEMHYKKGYGFMFEHLD